MIKNWNTAGRWGPLCHKPVLKWNGRLPFVHSVESVQHDNWHNQNIFPFFHAYILGTPVLSNVIYFWKLFQTALQPPLPPNLRKAILDFFRFFSWSKSAILFFGLTPHEPTPFVSFLEFFTQICRFFYSEQCYSRESAGVPYILLHFLLKENFTNCTNYKQTNQQTNIQTNKQTRWGRMETRRRLSGRASLNYLSRLFWYTSCNIKGNKH